MFSLGFYIIVSCIYYEKEGRKGTKSICNKAECSQIRIVCRNYSRGDFPISKPCRKMAASLGRHTFRCLCQHRNSKDNLHCSNCSKSSALEPYRRNLFIYNRICCLLAFRQNLQFAEVNRFYQQIKLKQIFINALAILLSCH